MLLVDFDVFVTELQDLTIYQTEAVSKRLRPKHGDLEIAKTAEFSFIQDPNSQDVIRRI